MQQRARRGKHMTQQQRESEAPSGATGRAMRVERDVKVTMRDGVRISLCVYRPEAAGRAPALFAASPYQHEFDSVPAFPLFLWRETGPVEWYVGQGYAYVHADVRGSGRSEGEFGFMDAAEQQDYVELIAWIAQAALVQRPRRRHRPVLLRDGAMADGDAQPARPRLHRALRRAGRPVPLLELSRRHFLQLPFGPGTRRCAPTTSIAPPAPRAARR